MDFLSCLLLLFGLAFVIIGISMKLRKRAIKTDENKNVQENAQSPDESLSADIPKVSYGPIHIYFGSQTGTAAGYAKLLGEEAAKNGFDPKIIDLIDFDASQLKTVKLAAFLMATHGEGDPTENAKDFSKWLYDSERGGDELKQLNFTTFGLGNKQYQFYNAQGKKTNENLERLGGKRVYKYGEGDDNESLEDDFNEWKTGIWEELKKIVEILPVTERTITSHKSMSNLPFILTITNEEEVDLDKCKDDKPYDFQMKQYLSSARAQITVIRELRQKTDDGSTLHIEIDNGSVGMRYRTADNLAIFPENSDDTVARVAKLLNLNLDDVFTLEDNTDLDKSIKFKFPFPTPISVRNYLTKFCDLEGPIRKKQLKELAEFCPKKEDKEKLIFLASPNGKIEYEALIHSRMWGLLDIIEHYEAHPDLANLVQISSLIAPRYYTIASSCKKDPNSIHLCFTMQRDILPDGSVRHGLTSKFCTHLFNLQNEGKKLPRVRVSVKESSFHLPQDPTAPVYMVGPGAGIAPFKGFVEEKEFCKKQGEKVPFGEMHLYFGCRGRNWDYLYKQEMLQYHEEKVLENFHVAFSRDNPQKVYVQNLLDLNQHLVIRDIFEKKGSFYICGAMGMGKAVVQKLVDFAMIHYNIDAEEANKKIEEMEKNKLIIKELWG